MFFAMNRNKRSIALDLKSDAGRSVAWKMIENADVLVESFGTGVADRLGIGQEAMRKLNPRLIYCSVSGFGRSGPLGQRPGYEPMMQAFSGMMAITGDPGGGPIRIAFSPCDQTTGIHAVAGILAALRMRDKTGLGTYLEVSLFETATALMGWHAQGYWMTGERPGRVGSGHASLCPYQAFMAKDDYILISVASNLLWRKLCDALDLKQYSDDPRFRTNADRVAHRAETVALVQNAIAQRTVSEWMDRLTKANVPCSPINHIDQLLSDPHTAARKMVLTYQHPVGGAMNGIAYPVQIEGLDRVARQPPPLLGEHTNALLHELGYTSAEIEEMHSIGAVGVEAKSPTSGDTENP
jgi:formyl-CoA transferase